MAGIHRSSTLQGHGDRYCYCWGWPGFTAQVHSTLEQLAPGWSWGWPGFTAQVHWGNYSARLGRAGDGRDSPLKYTYPLGVVWCLVAGDGRDSPLKYTTAARSPEPQTLGMAGIHRSSTLHGGTRMSWQGLGMAGIHRSSTLRGRTGNKCLSLGMAGIHRSSTLEGGHVPDRDRWGWPGFTAQVH